MMMCVYGNGASAVGIWVWKKQDFLRGLQTWTQEVEVLRQPIYPLETRHY